MKEFYFFPALIIILTATGVATLLSRFLGPHRSASRFLTIDGLRGYLALSVFIHHSDIWFFYLRDGKWQTPPSSFYAGLGFMGVSMFFMITAFLFFTKLLNARHRDFDWMRLFISRVLRLTPLYLFAVTGLIIMVGAKTRWSLEGSPWGLIIEAANWFTFTLFGSPDINRLKDTGLLMAGVTWTLPHEWKFYLSLPLLGILVRRYKPRILIVISCLVYVAWHPHGTILTSFIVGVLTALGVRHAEFCSFAQSKSANYLTCILLLLPLLIPPAYADYTVLSVGLAFAFIAGGCNLFGILVRPISIVLGEISYSIYLLHGLSLSLLFNYILGTELGATLTPLSHWLAIIIMTVPLIVFCAGTFKFIERPPMEKVDWLTNRFYRLIYRHKMNSGNEV